MSRITCIVCNYSLGKTNSSGRIYCPRCRRRHTLKREQEG